MKSNESLQTDVQDAIKYEPLLHAAEIGVTVFDGIVTLTGIVNTYAKKIEAEEATKRVSGVKAIVENIKVHFGQEFKKTDNEIAADVLNLLRWNWEITSDLVKVKVEDGWVTLTGELRWNFQRVAAQKAIGCLLFIKGLTNNISIKTDGTDLVEKEDIERAIKNNWAIEGRNINVSVHENKVKLKGNVNSIFEKDEAGRLAWNAKGVSAVENDLVVVYY